MDRKFIGLAFSIAVLTASAAAQMVASSGATGTVGNIPYISAATGTSTTLGSSPISVSGSNVGIGTTSPQGSLDVNGNVGAQSFKTFGYFTDLVNNAPWYGLGYSNLQLPLISPVGLPATQLAGYFGLNFQTHLGQMVVTEGGKVGIGITNPAYPLELVSAGTSSQNMAGFLAPSLSSGSSTFLKIGVADAVNSSANLAFNYIGPGSAANRVGLGFSGNDWLFNVLANGNVGIGTTSPQEKLEIDGNLRFTADGSVQKTAWTGVLCGGDYSEAVNAFGGKKAYEPGDILALAPDANGKVQKSQTPYSTMVAGIYATKPGVIGRRQNLVDESDELPMAMVGIVPAKVIAENGPIHQGDLLVTSSIPGYAMKGTDRSRLVGAVLGKAMGKLESGSGVIEVLVTLQ